MRSHFDQRIGLLHDGFTESAAKRGDSPFQFDMNEGSCKSSASVLISRFRCGTLRVDKFAEKSPVNLARAMWVERLQCDVRQRGTS